MPLNFAQTLLSIQASSASCERLYGDVRHGEEDRRQHVCESMSEMLSAICSFTLPYIKIAETQISFLSSRGQSTKDLEGLICNEFNKKKLTRTLNDEMK